MNKQISPGELAKGMRITVLSNKPIVLEKDDSGSEFGITVRTVSRENNSGKGDVLTILAIDLPYIVVRHEDNINMLVFNMKIDTRESVLMELSDEYVEAVCPHLKKENSII